MKIAAALVLSLLAVPAFAQGDGVEIEIVNRSTQTVAAVSGFPLDADGDFIEDNLGGLYEAVTPGTTATASFSGRCGPMLAVVMLENGKDLRTNLDTCKDTAIVVSDPASPSN